MIAASSFVLVFQEFKVWVGSIWQFLGCNTHHGQFQATYVMLLHAESGSEAQLVHYKYHVSTGQIQLA